MIQLSLRRVLRPEACIIPPGLTSGRDRMFRNLSRHLVSHGDMLRWLSPVFAEDPARIRRGYPVTVMNPYRDAASDIRADRVPRGGRRV